MLKNNWHIVSGKWKVEESSFTHEENVDRILPDSLLINKEKLIDGEIKAEVIFNSLKNLPPNGPHSAAIVFRYQSPQNYYFAGIGGYGKKFVIGKRRPEGSYAINTLGFAEEIKDNDTYNILLKISGRKFSLFLNGENGRIKILDAVDTIEPFYDNGNIGVMVFDNEDVTIKNFSFDLMPPKCFVVMPFNDSKLQKLKIYEEIIKKAASENKLEYIRADEIFDIKPIIMDIIESIDTSLIIIAEITKDNANVFYEVGIAHAKNSNVVLICDEKRRKKLPFDIAHLRCIFYNSEQVRGDNGDKLKEKLDRTIKFILEKTTRFTQQESPFNFQP
jgi:hypothetical protein